MARSKRRRFRVCWAGFVCGKISFNQPGKRRIWASTQTHAMAVARDLLCQRHRLERLRLIRAEVIELRRPTHRFVPPVGTNPRLNGGSDSQTRRPSLQYPLFDRSK